MMDRLYLLPPLSVADGALFCDHCQDSPAAPGENLCPDCAGRTPYLCPACGRRYTGETSECGCCRRERERLKAEAAATEERVEAIRREIRSLIPPREKWLPVAMIPVAWIVFTAVFVVIWRSR